MSANAPSSDAFHASQSRELLRTDHRNGSMPAVDTASTLRQGQEVMTHEMFRAAVDSGDLAQIRAYFEQDDVIADVRALDATLAPSRPWNPFFRESQPNRWLFGRRNPRMVWPEVSVQEDHVHVIAWLFNVSNLDYRVPATIPIVLREVLLRAVWENNVGMLELILTSRMFIAATTHERKIEILDDLLCSIDEDTDSCVIDTVIAHGAVVTGIRTFTPLDRCAGSASSYQLDALMKNGASAVGAKVLDASNEFSDVDVARRLVAHGVDVDAGDAIHDASMNGRYEFVRILIRDGFADVDARDDKGRTPLMACVGRDRAELGRLSGPQREIAGELIGHGANVMARDHSGLTPLHHAVQSDHVDVVEILLQGGAVPNALDDLGRAPLDLLRADQMIFDHIASIRHLLINSRGKDNRDKF